MLCNDCGKKYSIKHPRAAGIWVWTDRVKNEGHLAGLCGKCATIRENTVAVKKKRTMGATFKKEMESED
jgi:hypothetical protein